MLTAESVRQLRKLSEVSSVSTERGTGVELTELFFRSEDIETRLVHNLLKEFQQHVQARILERTLVVGCDGGALVDVVFPMVNQVGALR